MIAMHASLGIGAADISKARAEWRTLFPKVWTKDKSLWTNTDEDRWLGWLDIAGREKGDLPALSAFADEVRRQGWRDVVLIGMGGSSLGAEVLARSFGHQDGWPVFHPLDSTNPDQIGTLESQLDLKRTLFLVASKSGSTLEPNILKDYFFSRLGAYTQSPGRQFVAITDPGSAMEKEARQKGYAHIFYGEPAIGGRYSVLSRFGLVPAAAMGLDVARLIDVADAMAQRCRLAEAKENPGLALGLALGVLAANHGRDKITISASPSLVSVGAWLEQLIAESTGKSGKGLIPIDGEPLAAPSFYGEDRIFLHIGLTGEPEPAALTALEDAGHPVIRLALEETYAIGSLFFLSEIAVAVAGAVLGIHPFNQPDVEASKVKSRELAAQYERTGRLAEAEPLRRFDGIALYAEGENARIFARCATLAECLDAHLRRVHPGDYVALLAFLEQSPANMAALQAMRVRLRNRLKIATCAQFGPRFLHSTGQAYKGGPNSGVFLTLTAEPVRDLPLSEGRLSFGLVQKAQALGDFSVLNERGRRAIRLHLDKPQEGLMALDRALADALKDASR